MIEIQVELTSKELPKEKVKKKVKPVRLASCILVPLVILGIIGYVLFRLYANYASVNQARVQAEIKKTLTTTGVVIPSDDTGDPLEQYTTANATLPYSKTQWKVLDNFVFNFQIQYPLNTSALVRNAAGDQIWFLRRDGYMMKINILQSKESLMDYYNALQNTSEYSMSKVTFAKKNALLLQGNYSQMTIPSNQYIVANKGTIFDIWYEIYDPKKYPDDVTRISQMLQSFAFIG